MFFMSINLLLNCVQPSDMLIVLSHFCTPISDFRQSLNNCYIKQILLNWFK